LRFDTNGNGGTIIDSGTSITLFDEAIYNQIAGEFASQILRSLSLLLRHGTA